MHPLVFQTDFGLVDGAVSAMYGVAYSVNPDLKMHDLTHEITPYSVREASFRSTRGMLRSAASLRTAAGYSPWV